ncbi:hypothetical protein PPROV_000231800 [Pycnococcus provasolii]|uniref:Uncharacterized protein n=1 Tax=Pycnococcus provasolii TaxID=41880 RepID=A0A830HAS6_9CHLO|nr:hypothetical protein PPROV_000231800 [Pycnococcus provasolii]
MASPVGVAVVRAPVPLATSSSSSSSLPALPPDVVVKICSLMCSSSSLSSSSSCAPDDDDDDDDDDYAHQPPSHAILALALTCRALRQVISQHNVMQTLVFRNITPRTFLKSTGKKNKTDETVYFKKENDDDDDDDDTHSLDGVYDQDDVVGFQVRAPDNTISNVQAAAGVHTPRPQSPTRRRVRLAEKERRRALSYRFAQRLLEQHGPNVVELAFTDTPESPQSPSITDMPPPSPPPPPLDELDQHELVSRLRQLNSRLAVGSPSPVFRSRLMTLHMPPLRDDEDNDDDDDDEPRYTRMALSPKGFANLVALNLSRRGGGAGRPSNPDSERAGTTRRWRGADAMLDGRIGGLLLSSDEMLPDCVDDAPLLTDAVLIAALGCLGAEEESDARPPALPSLTRLVLSRQYHIRGYSLPSIAASAPRLRHVIADGTAMARSVYVELSFDPVANSRAARAYDECRRRGKAPVRSETLRSDHASGEQNALELDAVLAGVSDNAHEFVNDPVHYLLPENEKSRLAIDLVGPACMRKLLPENLHTSFAPRASELASAPLPGSVAVQCGVCGERLTSQCTGMLIGPPTQPHIAAEMYTTTSPDADAVVCSSIGERCMLCKNRCHAALDLYLLDRRSGMIYTRGYPNAYALSAHNIGTDDDRGSVRLATLGESP